MQCTDFRDRIAPFLDGELEGAEYRDALAHAEACGACRELLVGAHAVPLARPRHIPSPPGFWQAMDAALAQEADQPVPIHCRLRSWFGTEVSLSRGTVLVYLALLAALLAWRTRGEVPSPAAEVAVPAGVQAPSSHRVQPLVPVSAPVHQVY